MTNRKLQLQPAICGLLIGASLLALAEPACAKTKTSATTKGGEVRRVESELQQLEARVAQQDAVIASQQNQIQALRAEVQKGQVALDQPVGPAPPVSAAATMVPAQVLPSTDGIRLPAEVARALTPQETPAAPAPAPPAPPTQIASAAPPDKPVGEAPANSNQTQAVAALPESVGVLTPAGHFVFEPSLQYVDSSANRLVFQGVEIVPGVQLGVIDADNADHDTGVATATFRYGITNRLEAQIQVPLIDRQDLVTTLAQRDSTVNETQRLNGAGLGDIDISARYQINNIEPGEPIFIADFHIKPPTGRGPYSVSYDQYGDATSLATGSGFWGTEGGITMLYPSDPAVIFAGLNYTHNFSSDINKTIGGAFVGKVVPGDSIGASMGFGLSLNPRLSVSLGYSHIYIFETYSQIGGTEQTASSLQIGTLLMGWSFKLNDRASINTNFQFGVTSDAPNMQATVSIPMKF